MSAACMRDLDDSAMEYDIKAKEVSLDKELLQLVQAACKADNLARALDITRLMRNPATVEAAAKVAAFYHLPGLQERITGVASHVEIASRKRKPRRSFESLVSNSPIIPSSHHMNGHRAPPPAEFAPRTAVRRSFGGVQRDSTPIGRGDSYIPETPLGEDDPPPFGLASPPEKRKRFDDENLDPATIVSEVPSSISTIAPKNPFAKKSAPSNPFAKPAVAKPLDSVKSQSFFERVDDIETGKPKTKAKMAKGLNGHAANGKQTTLVGVKKKQDTLSSLEDEDGESQETPSARILEESLGQETVGSPEWAEDDMDED